MDNLEETHGKIMTVMGWLNEDLPTMATKIDKVPGIIKKAKQEIFKG